jgi:hypothetical protein
MCLQFYDSSVEIYFFIYFPIGINFVSVCVWWRLRELRSVNEAISGRERNIMMMMMVVISGVCIHVKWFQRTHLTFFCADHCVRVHKMLISPC